MNFIPKKTKFKKNSKGRRLNQISKGPNSLAHRFLTKIALKSMYFGRISSKQIETLKQTLNKTIKKTGKVIIQVFAHTPVTKKPIEIRMGKGKGNVDTWIHKVTVGEKICEIETTNTLIALKALRKIQYKLPLKTKIIYSKN